jgi:hypothetical protein
MDSLAEWLALEIGGLGVLGVLPLEVLHMILDAVFLAEFGAPGRSGAFGFFATCTAARALRDGWCAHTYRRLGGTEDALAESHYEFFATHLRALQARPHSTTLMAHGVDWRVAAAAGFPVRCQPGTVDTHTIAARGYARAARLVLERHGCADVVASGAWRLVPLQDVVARFVASDARAQDAALAAILRNPCDCATLLRELVGAPDAWLRAAWHTLRTLCATRELDGVGNGNVRALFAVYDDAWFGSWGAVERALARASLPFPIENREVECVCQAMSHAPRLVALPQEPGGVAFRNNFVVAHVNVFADCMRLDKIPQFEFSGVYTPFRGWWDPRRFVKNVGYIVAHGGKVDARVLWENSAQAAQLARLVTFDSPPNLYELMLLRNHNMQAQVRAVCDVYKRCGGQGAWLRLADVLEQSGNGLATCVRALLAASR